VGRELRWYALSSTGPKSGLERRKEARLIQKLILPVIIRTRRITKRRVARPEKP
jgi:hypothetical protein